ncbi:MAG: hypothetical protein JJT82_06330 [Legionellaceae bacterium]|nr:hypothetical protein [Legionellaceae bacterium]
MKLRGFLKIYQAGCELVQALEAAEKTGKYVGDLPTLKREIQTLKDFLKPYREIYLIVGDSIEHYLFHHCGVQFTAEDSDEEIAKKMLVFVASDTFVAIRKNAASACSQYLPFSEHYRKDIQGLSPSLMSFEAFQNELIKCVQIFSQCSLLGRELVKESAQMADSAIFEMASQVFKCSADYADVLQSGLAHSEKTIHFASTAMLPGYDKQRKDLKEQIQNLRLELQKARDELALLDDKYQLAEKMMTTKQETEQNQLFALWKTSSPINTAQAHFPKETQGMAELAQDINRVTTKWQTQDCLIKDTQDKLKGLTDKSNSIKNAMTKMSPAMLAALKTLNQSQANAASLLFQKYTLLPVRITPHTDQIITGESKILTDEDRPPQTMVTPKSPKSSGRLFEKIRGRSATHKNIVLTRQSPPTSPRGTGTSSASSSSESLRPETRGDDNTDDSAALRLKFFTATNRPARTVSAPPKREVSSSVLKGDEKVLPEKKGTADIAGSPTIKQRIERLNAAGGITFSPQSK